MIYTSYFANTRKIPSTASCVCICRLAPKWFEGLHYKRLAPSLSKMVEYKRTKDMAAYRAYFMDEVLAILSARSVLNGLTVLTSGAKDIVLLCYEKDADTCHRTFVREWLNENGIPCEEWDEDKHLHGQGVQLKMDI